jgi:hypothetical protein
MLISKATLEVLKNFASINTNILVRQGSTLRTISAGKNIFAVAEVEEEFPLEFGIYDLNSLLGLLSMAGDDDEVNFGEKSIRVKRGEGVFEYFYADPSILTVAPDKTIEVDKVFQFKLTEEDIVTINKAAAVVSASTVSVLTRKGKVILTIGDPDTPASNNYKRLIGQSKVEFDCRLAIENFRVIPGDYVVTLSAKKVMHLKNAERKLQYWLALDPKSSI